MEQKTTITVEKRVDVDTYNGPAIVYELTCSTDDTTYVRLREAIPGEFSPADLGFHQKYNADAWWIGDDEIVFEYPIGTEEMVTTIVGVRTSDPESCRAFLSRPTVEIASAADEDDRSWGEVSDAVVDFGIDGDALTSSQAATDGGEVPVAENGSDDLGSDRDGDDEGTSDSHDTSYRDSDDIESAIPSVEETETVDTDSGPFADTDEIVDRFVDELASDSLSDSQRRRLREALGVNAVTSMDARIEHCQQRLSDLAAYVDALETFLDEEGSGQQLLSDFRDDVAAVESHLASLETDLDETASGQQDLRERVDEVEEEVASLRALREDVVSMGSQLDETTAEIRSEIESLSTTVERLQEWQRGVTSAFEDLQSVES